MDIRKYVQPKIVASVWSEAERASFIGASLFPHVKQNTLDLAWIKGHKGVQAVLKASAYDAKAEIRDRIPFEKIDTEMPYFKEAYKVTEKDLLAINAAEADGNPFLKDAVRHIYEDQKDLIASAYVNPERMAMQLLAPINGDMKITMGAADKDYVYNYDPNGTWKATNYKQVSPLWSTPATATPVKDLMGMAKVLRKKGAKPAYLLMNSNTLALLPDVVEIQNYLVNQNTATIMIDEDMVVSFLEKKLGVKVILNDGTFVDEAGVTKDFYPDGYVSLLPNGPIGKTHFAPTPEEIQGGEGFKLIDGKIACRVIHSEGDPVGTKTVVAETVLPSFEGMDLVAVLKVA